MDDVFKKLSFCDLYVVCDDICLLMADYPDIPHFVCLIFPGF